MVAGAPHTTVADEAAAEADDSGGGRGASLPDPSSRCGSRGLVVSTFLPSWSRDGDVWGESEMKTSFRTTDLTCRCIDPSTTTSLEGPRERPWPY